MDDAIDQNADLALAILMSGLQSFGVSSNKVSIEGKNNWKGTATTNDLEKARSTIRQFFRDWSAEGKSEREVCYGPVMAALDAERQACGNSKMKVLVPGAGLGRLVFELCSAGYDTEGNEISYHQLLASSYILNYCPKEKAHTVFPWVHTFSNHLSRKNHLQSVLVPDVHTADNLNKNSQQGVMCMTASDFLMLYNKDFHKDAFDAVATVFFLDTVRWLYTLWNRKSND